VTNSDNTPGVSATGNITGGSTGPTPTANEDDAGETPSPTGNVSITTSTDVASPGPTEEPCTCHTSAGV
jgi:hypothetical protein